MRQNTKKNENYNSILKEADTYDNYDNGYYTAIVTDPTRTEAYLKLNDKLTDDFVLDRDEAQILNRLMVGIDCKDHNGRVHTYDVMAKLKGKIQRDMRMYAIRLVKAFYSTTKSMWKKTDTPVRRSGSRKRRRIIRRQEYTVRYQIV